MTCNISLHHQVLECNCHECAASCAAALPAGRLPQRRPGLRRAQGAATALGRCCCQAGWRVHRLQGRLAPPRYLMGQQAAASLGVAPSVAYRGRRASSAFPVQAAQPVEGIYCRLGPRPVACGPRVATTLHFFNCFPQSVIQKHRQFLVRHPWLGLLSCQQTPVVFNWFSRRQSTGQRQSFVDGHEALEVTTELNCRFAVHNTNPRLVMDHGPIDTSPSPVLQIMYHIEDRA